ncbi:DsbA family protein [Roseibium sp. SCPC15]|uniref:DsbA family protein n=1 Tax=Roseibium sp. SCP15 TaxID=3141376 RepID=UPI00333B35B7
MTRFTIVYDTYCGWCYGAHPVFAALLNSASRVEVLHRYLFQGVNAHRMADGFGAMAWSYDQRIASLTAQPFSQAYRDNVLGSEAEVLESGLTAQAAALVHGLGPGTELALAATLQKARYVEGKSTADREHVVAALVRHGIDGNEAEEKLGSRALRDAATKLAQQARHVMASVGAGGVPALILEQDGRRTSVDISRFFKEPETIRNLAA